MRVAEDVDVDREFATGPYSRPYRGVKFKGYETHTSYFDRAARPWADHGAD